MDAQIGKVLTHVSDAGLEEDTLIVFASDNGPVTENWFFWWEVNAYGETAGYRGRKHLLYEGGIRVPAIFKWKGKITAGTETDAVLNGLDLFSTFAGVAGVETPTDRPIDSRDLSGLLFENEMPEPKAHFWHLHSRNGIDYAIQKDHWKLLLDRQQQPVALYDLKSDPYEMLDRRKSLPAKDDKLAARDDIAADLLEIFETQFKPMLPADKDRMKASFSN